MGGNASCCEAIDGEQEAKKIERVKGSETKLSDQEFTKLFLSFPGINKVASENDRIPATERLPPNFVKVDLVPDCLTAQSRAVFMQQSPYQPPNSVRISADRFEGPYLDEAKRDYYAGQLKSLAMNGWGRQISREGVIYEGQFLGGNKNGHGRMIQANGDLYEGEWWFGTMVGQGIFRGIDGSIYEGEWLDGQQHG